MCNPDAEFLDITGTIAANRLAYLFRDHLAHAFLPSAPHGYAAYRVRRFIHENWPALKKLAHEVHDAPRIIGPWPGYAMPEAMQDMPDYAVSG